MPFNDKILTCSREVRQGEGVCVRAVCETDRNKGSGEGERKTSRRSAAAGGRRGETREAQIVLRQPHSSPPAFYVDVRVSPAGRHFHPQHIHPH